tara:strand:- start:379 stop:864 length:486 start_codon:yes stop_codon:yes gene_type:complete
MAKKSIDQMRDEIVEFIIANEEHRMQKIDEEERAAGEEDLSYPSAGDEYDEGLRYDITELIDLWSDEEVKSAYNEGKMNEAALKAAKRGRKTFPYLGDWSPVDKEGLDISGGWRISNLGHLPTDLQKEAKEQYASRKKKRDYVHPEYAEPRKKKPKGAKLM